jgi:hypothetical protein
VRAALLSPRHIRGNPSPFRDAATRRHARIRRSYPPVGTSPGGVGPYQIELIATDSQGPADCSSGYAGWVRNVTNQVQYQTGAAFAVSGLTVADTLKVGSPSQLGMEPPRVKAPRLVMVVSQIHTLFVPRRALGRERPPHFSPGP